MKTAVRRTSLDAYQDLLPRMGDLEKKVFGSIKWFFNKNHRWPTDKEILKVVSDFDKTKKWAINDVTGRRNGLMKKGLVMDAGTTIDLQTNKRVTTWKTV